MTDRNSLEVLDTSEALTKEELKELKQLAQLSKSAKWIVAFGIAIVSLFGMDKIATWFDGK
jgi:hypothetical protein